MQHFIQRKISKRNIKKLKTKRKDLKEKEQTEKEQSNFVSGYANYNNDSPIKSLNANPLYNKNMFVKKGKTKN